MSIANTLTTRRVIKTLLACLILTGISACDNSSTNASSSYSNSSNKHNHNSVQVKQIELTPELAKGKATWEASCKVCHEPGLAHAPRIGDSKQWTKRLTKGIDQVIKNAIEGYNEMPAKGANPELSDLEVELAVRYMIASSQ